MIKVCGLRRTEDIEYANELLPDYVGFIFAKSKRHVIRELAMELRNKLKVEIKTVGIFVNEDLETVLDIANSVRLDVIQLHGDEDTSYIEELKEELKEKNMDIEVWKAIRVKDKKSLDGVLDLDVDGILLDTYSKDAYGGLGECFNWDIVSDLSSNSDKKIILAGGIDEWNIRQAKSTVKPDIIDVSSGVETEGFKDYEKMKMLIEKGRL